MFDFLLTKYEILGNIARIKMIIYFEQDRFKRKMFEYVFRFSTSSFFNQNSMSALSAGRGTN